MSDCFKHGWRHEQNHCPTCAKTKPKHPVPVYISKPPTIYRESIWKRILNWILGWFR